MTINLRKYAVVPILWITSATAQTDPHPHTSPSWIETLNGYLRSGHQITGIDQGSDYTDSAIGGKLHLGTQSYHGLSLGASLYTTYKLQGPKAPQGVPFFDAANKSYTIVGEAYLKADMQHTSVVLGRQALNTPFLDTDDIGMVPNTFRGISLVNNLVTNMTLTAAHIDRMSGVDTEAPSQFQPVNNNRDVQLFGADYTLSENTTLSLWYYNLNNPNTRHLVYSEVGRNYSHQTISINLGIQYAHRSYKKKKRAEIIGVTGDIGHNPSGITLGVAYNHSQNNPITNGFGGGPFFTSAQFLTLAEAGKNGTASMKFVEWSGNSEETQGVLITIATLGLKNRMGQKAREYDYLVSYQWSDNSTVEAIYSDIDAFGSEVRNLRVFLNLFF